VSFGQTVRATVRGEMAVTVRQAVLAISLLAFSASIQNLYTGEAVVSIIVVVRELLHRLEELVDWLEDVAESVSKEQNEGLTVGLSGGPGNSSEAEHFATSTHPRRRRPDGLLYRVGHIIFHRQMEVRGVVMGWDLVAKAPLSWLKQVYGVVNTDVYEEPHYTVICDTSQGVVTVENEVHYFAQSLIDNDSGGGAINNPLLEKVFAGFDVDTGRYKLTKQLRRLYPRD